MKFSVMFTEETMQLNLEAEGRHEEEALRLLRRFEAGAVSIKELSHLGMNQAGYLREFGPAKHGCAVVVHRPDPDPQ